MMRAASKYNLPDVIAPIRIAPEKKLMYLKIISSLKEDFSDRDFHERNWWEIIMPYIEKEGFKFTLKDIAIILLVLRGKRFII